MDNHIIFSKTFQNKILTKYRAQQYEGLCYFEINDELIEQIKTMRDLAVIGSGHVNRFYGVTAVLNEFIKLYLMIPNLDPEYLSTDKTFINTLKAGHEVWYPKIFETEKLKRDTVIRCEGVFIEVMIECFSIAVEPHENKYFNSIAISNKISLATIGLS